MISIKVPSHGNNSLYELISILERELSSILKRYNRTIWTWEQVIFSVNREFSIIWNRIYSCVSHGAISMTFCGEFTKCAINSVIPICVEFVWLLLKDILTPNWIIINTRDNGTAKIKYRNAQKLILVLKEARDGNRLLMPKAI